MVSLNVVVITEKVLVDIQEVLGVTGEVLKVL